MNRLKRVALGKHCPQCNRMLPLSAYYKNRRTLTGVSVCCRECVLAEGHGNERTRPLNPQRDLRWSTGIDDEPTLREIQNAMDS